MDKAFARIVKKGDKWCVVSEDGTKNLGCSNTREGAVKRLQQVEYFKHSKGQDMNYQDAFRNMAKSLTGKEVNPADIGKGPDSTPNKVNIVDSLVDGFSIGSIANQPSKRLLDRKDHFPVFTETQARSSMSRAMQLSEVPIWYNGNLSDLRKEVYEGIAKAHPHLTSDISVSVPIARVVALSDGQTPAETTKTSINNPADVTTNKAAPVHRPTITTAELAEACKDENYRVVLAGKLMECIEQQESDISEAKKLASKLLKGGLSADQFDVLSTYLQSDILRELLYSTSKINASNDERRRALLDRLKGD